MAISREEDKQKDTTISRREKSTINRLEENQKGSTHIKRSSADVRTNKKII